MRSGQRAAVTSLMLAVAIAAGDQGGAAEPVTPQQVVDELLAADRAFSKSGAQKDVVGALSAMLADDVVMPVPGGRFARGATDAVAALRANPDDSTGRVAWTPIRGGVSADGQHGFTFGYMTLGRADGTKIPMKYLAYWIRGSGGWRVAAYKRNRANEAPQSLEVMPPSLPERLVPVSRDEAAIGRARESLDAAERGFSDEAQKIGIGPAFVKYGRSDAINLGPPTASQVIVGSEAIGRSVGSGYPPDQPGVSWAPDSVIVASSCDLGVTIGMIRPNGPPLDSKAPQAFPFFTIWRRTSPSDPWRYIAE